MSRAGIGPVEQAYAKFRGTLQGIKNVIRLRRPMLDTPMQSAQMEALFHDMRRRRLELNDLSRTVGLRRFARRVQNDTAFDPASEWTATSTLITEVMSIAKGLIPLSADGSLRGRSWTVDDRYDYPTIAIADMAALRTAVDALDTDIDITTVT